MCRWKYAGMPLLMKQTETTHQTGSERQTPPDAMLHTGG